jgi:catechol 2,3-dioxygenase-like lactoylglutathione lyase family enzyme
MALYIGTIVINVLEIERAKAFWTAALGYVVRDTEDDFVILTDPKRRWANISLQLWPEPKQSRNRVHLDLYSNNQMAEVQRLESLGAVKLKWDYPPDADYVVMADPDGNEFCIIDSAYSQD